jgi:hypothetical protein
VGAIDKYLERLAGVSLAAVIFIPNQNEIAVALDDGFPKDDYVQQTVEMVAMYRPEGGEFLFDTAAIRQRLIETMKHLQNA